MPSLREQMLNISTESHSTISYTGPQVSFEEAMLNFSIEAAEIDSALENVSDSEALIKNGEEIVAASENITEATPNEAVMSEIAQRTVVEGLGYNPDKIVSPATESSIGQQISIEGFKEFLGNVKDTITGVMGAIFKKITGLFGHIFSAKAAIEKKISNVRNAIDEMGDVAKEGKISAGIFQYGNIGGKKTSDILKALKEDMKDIDGLVKNGSKLTIASDSYLAEATDAVIAIKKKHNMSSFAASVVLTIFVTGPLIASGVSVITGLIMAAGAVANSAATVVTGVALYGLGHVLGFAGAVKISSTTMRKAFGDLTEDQREDIANVYRKLNDKYRSIKSDIQKTLAPFKTSDTTYVFKPKLANHGHQIEFDEPLNSKEAKSLPRFKSAVYADEPDKGQIELDVPTKRDMLAIVDHVEEVKNLIYSDLDKFTSDLTASAGRLKKVVSSASGATEAKQEDISFERVMALQSSLSISVATYGSAEFQLLNKLLGYVMAGTKKYGNAVENQALKEGLSSESYGFGYRRGCFAV